MWAARKKGSSKKESKNLNPKGDQSDISEPTGGGPREGFCGQIAISHPIAINTLCRPVAGRKL